MLQAEQMQTNQKTEVGKFDEDIALMLQVADGSEHAFRMLVGRWQKPIMNYFFRSCGDVHTSEDLAQQTFLNLFRARAAYAEYLGRGGEGGKPKAKFSTYLFHIARNVLISEFRKSARRPADATDPAEMNFESRDPHDSPLSELEEIFYAAVEDLPENQRTAILLLKQQQLSYEEIADIMKANVQSVKTWIHRARNRLREALREADNPKTHQRNEI